MKTIRIFFATMLISSTYILPAQISNLAVEAFESKYPGAEAVEWEEEEGGYEVEFEWEGQEMEAEFDTEGNWLATEWEMDTEDLPEATLRSITINYKGFEIEEVEGMESAALGKHIYSVELEKDDTELEILINSDGEILRKKYYKKDGEKVGDLEIEIDD